MLTDEIHDSSVLVPLPWHPTLGPHPADPWAVLEALSKVWRWRDAGALEREKGVVRVHPTIEWSLRSLWLSVLAGHALEQPSPLILELS